MLAYILLGSDLESITVVLGAFKRKEKAIAAMEKLAREGNIEKDEMMSEAPAEDDSIYGKIRARWYNSDGVGFEIQVSELT